VEQGYASRDDSDPPDERLNSPAAFARLRVAVAQKRRGFKRRARRTFYRVVQTVVPESIRKPVGRAVKGAPPTPEEQAAKRQANAAKKQQATTAKQVERAQRADSKRRRAQEKLEASQKAGASAESAATPDEH
jgi:hypothetical protein